MGWLPTSEQVRNLIEVAIVAGAAVGYCWAVFKVGEILVDMVLCWAHRRRRDVTPQPLPTCAPQTPRSFALPAAKGWDRRTPYEAARDDARRS